MTHLALLHRCRNALMWPADLQDKEALIADINEAIRSAYPRRVRSVCWCGDDAIGGRHCNAHSQFEVGEG
jgi:hypothetical protein